MNLKTWERRTDGPMAALAVIFLAVYAWPILEPDLPPEVVTALGATGLAIWVVFGIDFVMRVRLADQRWHYLRRHWIDLLLLVLPVFRPLRALRAVQALAFVGRRTSASFRGRAAVYIAAAVPLVLFVAAVAMLNAERDAPNTNIRTFGDALWWGATTIATVGYGDVFPVTLQGRLIAGLLMTAGIALLGVVTASLASWFVEQIGEVTEADAATQRQVAALTEELRQLRDALTSGGPDPEAPPSGSAPLRP